MGQASPVRRIAIFEYLICLPDLHSVEQCNESEKAYSIFLIIHKNRESQKRGKNYIQYDFSNGGNQEGPPDCTPSWVFATSTATVYMGLQSPEILLGMKRLWMRYILFLRRRKPYSHLVILYLISRVPFKQFLSSVGVGFVLVSRYLFHLSYSAILYARDHSPLCCSAWFL